MSKAVLIIDDDAGITRTFARILQKQGYETDMAYTGKEALKKASLKRYVVALVDIRLPDMNGMELLEKLRELDGEMVRIVVTGSQINLPKKGDEADAYLLKPVTPQELLEVIKQKTRKPSTTNQEI